MSVKSDYAARAVLGLARRYASGESCRAEDLAAEQSVPVNYLAQILSDLRAQGIVRSVRGKAGGYLLGRAPAAITLADVLRAVEGSVFETAAIEDPQCPPELRRVWAGLSQTMETAAGAVHFQQLADAGADKEKMYYI